VLKLENTTSKHLSRMAFSLCFDYHYRYHLFGISEIHQSGYRTCH